MRGTIISTMCMSVAFVLAASCSKIEENDTSVKGNGRTVITAVAEAIGGGTKAHNQYSYDVLWDKGDQIYVVGGEKANTFTVSDESAGTDKGRFTEDTPSFGIIGDIEAIYPASLKTDDGYVWPAVQTNNQVPPMYAKQTIPGTGNEVVSFSSLGAMLQIVFNSTTPDITITSVTIKDAARPLSGKFTVDNKGQAVIDEDARNVGITLDLGTGVNMGKSAKYFYLAIPAGNYSGDEITLTFTDSKSGVECVMKSTTFPDIARNTVGRITLSGTFKDKVPAGALPGKFTVNDEGKQVYFSKGNLQATYHSATDSYSWGFAANQHDFVGDAPGNTTIGNGQADGAVVDLFCWSTPATYYGIATPTGESDYPGDFIDWGKAYCNDNDITLEDSWRTLSNFEWKYLIDNHKHCWATVNGVGGVVIAPDGFEGELSSSYIPSHLSEQNLLFLPAAGYRSGSTVGELYGHYFSGTLIHAENSWGVYFYDNYLNTMTEKRNVGISVRLVTDVNYVPSQERRYTVDFEFSISSHTYVMVNAGSTVSKPEDPAGTTYIWYKDYKCTVAWDFDNDRVYRDMYLYGKKQ